MKSSKKKEHLAADEETKGDPYSYTTQSSHPAGLAVFVRFSLLGFHFVANNERNGRT